MKSPLRPVLGLLRRALAALTAVALVAFFVVYVSIRAAAHSTVTHDAYVIIVLGAGQWDGRPSDVMLARCAEAAALYRAGRAPLIISTGGARDDSPSDAGVAAECLQSLGVAADDILLEETSRSTVENLVNSRDIMRQRGLDSAILVSCPFHLFRARRIARDLGMDAQLGAAMDSPLETSAALRVALTVRDTLAYLRYILVERPHVRRLESPL